MLCKTFGLKEYGHGVRMNTESLVSLMGDMCHMHMRDWLEDEIQEAEPASSALQLKSWKQLFQIENGTERRNKLKGLVESIGTKEYVPYWVFLANYWITRNKECLMMSNISSDLKACHEENIMAVERNIAELVSSE